MENETQMELLNKKAIHFCNSQNIIHVTYKNGKWKRGTIKEVSSDFFIIDERLDGEMPIFFLEIEDIQLYHDNKEEKNGI